MVLIADGLLRLSAGEAETFLSRTMALGLTGDQAQKLHRRTEGRIGA